VFDIQATDEEDRPCFFGIGKSILGKQGGSSTGSWKSRTPLFGDGKK